MPAIGYTFFVVGVTSACVSYDTCMSQVGQLTLATYRKPFWTGSLFGCRKCAMPTFRLFHSARNRYTFLCPKLPQLTFPIIRRMYVPGWPTGLGYRNPFGLDHSLTTGDDALNVPVYVNIFGVFHCAKNRYTLLCPDFGQLVFPTTHVYSRLANWFWP